MSLKVQYHPVVNEENLTSIMRDDTAKTHELEKLESFLNKNFGRDHQHISVVDRAIQLLCRRLSFVEDRAL